MKTDKRQGFLSGAFILVIATAIVKVIGAFFKMPLTELLGGDGMGYFSTAYSLFNPVSAIAITGLPVAVAKIVAANGARGNYNNIRKLFRITTIVFSAIGVLGFLIIAFLAKPFSEAVSNPGAYYALTAIAPAMLFACLMSIFRGYYQGLHNMFPTAISQITEALFKLICGYLFASIILNYGMSSFSETGVVFGKAASSQTEALSIVLPFASAGAILGISLSTGFGFLYLFLRHKIKKDGITEEQLNLSPPASSSKALVRELLKTAVPVTLAALVTNLTTLIDVSSLMQRIAIASRDGSEIIYGMYDGLIPETAIYAGNLPNYLYGIYNSMVITVFNLVPAVIAGIGISALPMVTHNYEQKNIAGLRDSVESVLRIASLFAIPAGLGIFSLSEPILRILFYSRTMEIEIATPLLCMMGITCMFSSMCLPVYNMLQGIGKASSTVFIMLIGGAVKLSVNYFLAAKPEINIMAAPIGSLCCYGVIIIISLIVLLNTLKIRINLFKIFGKTFFCGAVCALTAKLSNELLSKIFFGSRLKEAFSVLVSIGIGCIFYAFVLFLTKTITKNEIFMLPKGKNIAKVLEKLKII
ncbi:MAG: polysaccharide biosynthesis C-terminal domain-containing protein [Oscillospiraceae bacterium]|nr:polysaccharide biosynthesis C-terminal domain-containing protein [Oscillospiraceae bacterium]